jgi:hypothetical protein
MMKNRCLNSKAMDYAYYGGRGIKIDPAWHDYDKFVAAMGERPEGLTLDRIEVHKNYCADNCRWASRQTQSRNRDYTLNLTFGGKTQKVWEWSAELNISTKTFYHRLWSLKCGAITKPQAFKKNMRGLAA